jgi:hypothetical protein
VIGKICFGSILLIQLLIRPDTGVWDSIEYAPFAEVLTLHFSQKLYGPVRCQFASEILSLDQI